MINDDKDDDVDNYHNEGDDDDHDDDNDKTWQVKEGLEHSQEAVRIVTMDHEVS